MSTFDTKAALAALNDPTTPIADLRAIKKRAGDMGLTSLHAEATRLLVERERLRRAPRKPKEMPRTVWMRDVLHVALVNTRWSWGGFNPRGQLVLTVDDIGLTAWNARTTIRIPLIKPRWEHDRPTAGFNERMAHIERIEQGTHAFITLVDKIGERGDFDTSGSRAAILDGHSYSTEWLFEITGLEREGPKTVWADARRIAVDDYVSQLEAKDAA